MVAGLLEAGKNAVKFQLRVSSCEDSLRSVFENKILPEGNDNVAGLLLRLSLLLVFCLLCFAPSRVSPLLFHGYSVYIFFTLEF